MSGGKRSRIINNFELDAVRGVLEGDQGIRSGCIKGYNRVTRNSIPEPVTAGSSISYDFLTTPETLVVNCASAADDAAGTGAREVEVTYLNADFEERTETFATVGAGDSAQTSEPAIRALRAKVTRSGTFQGANAGTINIEGSVSGDRLLRILGGDGIPWYAVYTVPAGHTMYITSMSTNVQQLASDPQEPARFIINVYDRVDVTSAPFYASRLVWETPGQVGSFHAKFEPCIVVEEKSDVLISAAGVGAGEPWVMAKVGYILVDNAKQLA